MNSAKENFVRMVNHEQPDRLVANYEALGVVRVDPVTALDWGARKKGATCKDIYGTTVVWPEGQPAGMPHVTEDNKVIKNIEDWRDYLKLPDYDAMEADMDWSENAKLVSQIDRDQKLITSILPTGLFERLHFLMGFEDTLVNLLTEEEAVEDLLDELLKVRMAYVRQLAKHMKPEVIISHDDWGNKKSLFMKREVWIRFFKERYRKLYDYMHELGIIVVHHADCHCAAIAEDMAEIGVDIWQGVIPDNDITDLQKRLKGSMVLMGGINSAIDKKDWSESEVRTETRSVCEAYGPGGAFIPCLTYGGPTSIFPGVTDTVVDEIHRYNRDTYGIG